jgi:hypothetical protein
MTLAGDPVNHSGKVTPRLCNEKAPNIRTIGFEMFRLILRIHFNMMIQLFGTQPRLECTVCASLSHLGLVITSPQIPVVLLPPRLSKKALPLESFLLPHFSEERLSPASTLPFSKICWTTSTSTCVPNSLSSSCFEGRRRRPCGP